MDERHTEFTGGAALVVGGSGAIGAAICAALAQAGSDVVLTYKTNLVAAENAVKAVQQTGRMGMCIQLDLEKADSIRPAVDTAVRRFGHVHSVVYASGPPIEYKYINEIGSNTWSSVINADVNGCFNLIEATLPHFRNRKSGTYLAVITAAVDRAPPAGYFVRGAQGGNRNADPRSGS